MTAVTPHPLARPTTVTTRGTVTTRATVSAAGTTPGPHLMDVPLAGRIVGIVFVLTVALFLIGVIVIAF